MTLPDALAYVKDSKVRHPLFHETRLGRSPLIREYGIDFSKSSRTVEFASGHYMAVHEDYARNRFGSEMLNQVALIKNPFVATNREAFLSWVQEVGVPFVSEEYIPKLAALELLERGFDGMHILRDTSDEARSETWLAFAPQQVVTFDNGCTRNVAQAHIQTSG